MTSVLENMKRTAQAVCYGYEQWEVNAVLAPRADVCVHEVGPRSLGRPPKNNSQYREYFATVQSLFHDFKVGRHWRARGGKIADMTARLK